MKFCHEEGMACKNIYVTCMHLKCVYFFFILRPRPFQHCECDEHYNDGIEYFDGVI